MITERELVPRRVLSASARTGLWSASKRIQMSYAPRFRVLLVNSSVFLVNAVNSVQVVRNPKQELASYLNCLAETNRTNY